MISERKRIPCSVPKNSQGKTGMKRKASRGDFGTAGEAAGGNIGGLGSRTRGQSCVKRT